MQLTRRPRFGLFLGIYKKYIENFGKINLFAYLCIVKVTTINNMKKIFLSILIVVAMITVTSCGSAVKVGQGCGMGYSMNEQVAQDKAYASAMADLSYGVVTDVDASTTVITEDVNGKPVEATTIKKKVSTHKKFSGVNKKMTVAHKDEGYRAFAVVKGHYEE